MSTAKPQQTGSTAMPSNSQRTALVTGASSGIGRASAEALARAGFTVFGTSRKPGGDSPSQVSMLACDVTDEASVASLVSDVLASTGRIDILVNNAGLGLFGGAEESSAAQVQRLFDVNLFGVVRVINAVLPSMRVQRQGRIINLSSALGFVPAPYSAYYAASKFALEGFSESLDHEVRTINVRVSLIEPGTVKSNFDQSALEPDRQMAEYDAGRAWVHEFYKRSLLTAVTPEEVADAVRLAATEKRPRLRYPVGKVARQVGLLRRLTPARMFDKILRQHLGDCRSLHSDDPDETRGGTQSCVVTLPDSVTSFILLKSNTLHCLVSDHFDGQKFYGPVPSGRKPLPQLLRWRLAGKRAVWPRRFANPASDPVLPRSEPGTIRVTVIGRVTSLFQIEGVNLLVDPVWSERASPLSFLGPRRARRPGIVIDDLPKIDLVLVSHNHYDHLDLATLKSLVDRHDPLIVTPLGNDTIIRRKVATARTVALDWDQHHQLEPFSITAVPVQHWSARGVRDRNAALWAGFVLRWRNHSLFFAGDTRFGGGWWAKRARQPDRTYDLAMLPIGAYEPRWSMEDSHMMPEEALASFDLLDARYALGCHFGTFNLTDEPVADPTDRLTAELLRRNIDPARFRTLDPGQAWTIRLEPSAT
eukprot:gene19739-25671_t